MTHTQILKSEITVLGLTNDVGRVAGTANALVSALSQGMSTRQGSAALTHTTQGDRSLNHFGVRVAAFRDGSRTPRGRMSRRVAPRSRSPRHLAETSSLFHKGSDTPIRCWITSLPTTLRRGVSWGKDARRSRSARRGRPHTREEVEARARFFLAPKRDDTGGF